MLAPLNPEHKDLLKVWDEHTQTYHHLELLSAYKAHKTLGHYKDPAGTQKEQYRQLKKKSDATTAFLWTCHLSRREAWTYYYACYLPSVSYPLACSTLSRTQLDRIQRNAMKIIGIAWFQEQVGVSFSILDNVQAILPHLESIWFKSLRQFLCSIHARLQQSQKSRGSTIPILWTSS